MSETPASLSLPRAPGLVQSSFRIFDLSLGDMLWSRRTIFMGLLVAAPVLVALMLRLLVGLGAPIFEEPRGGTTSALRMTGPAIFGLMMWGAYLRFIVPVLGVFYGTSLIADEVEDKTITYLFSRPIPHGAVLVGKYLAYLACTVCVVLPSIVLVYLLVVPLKGSLGAAFPDLLKDLGLIAVCLAVYGSLFAWVGARFKRPLVVGLVFVLGWEPIALALPGNFKAFTVAYYVQGLVPHAMPGNTLLTMMQAIFREPPGLAASLASLAAIWAVFLALGAWEVSRKEYILEQ